MTDPDHISPAAARRLDDGSLDKACLALEENGETDEIDLFGKK